MWDMTYQYNAVYPVILSRRHFAHINRSCHAFHMNKTNDFCFWRDSSAKCCVSRYLFRDVMSQISTSHVTYFVWMKRTVLWWLISKMQYISWSISKRHVTIINESCPPFHMCDMTHSCAWHDLFIRAAEWRILLCFSLCSHLEDSYRVAKTHRIPYLYRSFSAKVTYI